MSRRHKVGLAILSSFVLWLVAGRVEADEGGSEWLVEFSNERARFFGQESFHSSLSGVKRLDRVVGFSDQWYAVELEGGRAEGEQRLSKDPAVRRFQPNYQYRAFYTPTDPSYSFQWNLPQVGAPAAWDYDATVPLHGGDSSIVVAVLDTGVSYEAYLSFLAAPDLIGTTFVSPKDFSNNDDHPNDDHGHGTHVAGTIAQNADNGVSGVGLAHQTSIMPVKVLDGNGFGSTATIAAGIDYARQQGADVINLSLGGTSDDPILHTAIQNAVAAGIIVVAAAGNDGTSSLSYPAAYSETLSVAATRYDQALANYSNRGAGLDLVAPGGDLDVDQNGDGQFDGILQQTCLTSACNSFSNFYYEGTSQATPHVSAAAALLLAAGALPGNVANLLTSTATDLGVAGYDTTFGSGFLNVASALNVAISDTTAPVGSLSIHSGAPFTASAHVTLTVAATDVGSSVTAMSFSNDATTFSAWETFAATRSDWDLSAFGGSAADGDKAVTVRFRDAAGNTSTSTDTIVLDGTKPPTVTLTGRGLPPADLVVVEHDRPSSIRRIAIIWNPVVDSGSGLVGYRLQYTDSATPDFATVPLTPELSYQPEAPTTSRTRYLHVAAEDAAGNIGESATFTYIYASARLAATIPGSRSIELFDAAGKKQRTISFSRLGAVRSSAIASLVAGDGQAERLAVHGAVRSGLISIVKANGTIVTSFPAYDSLTAQFRIIAADVDGDGRDELVVSPTRGALSVRILNQSGKLIRQFRPFGSSYDGGISVATGQLDGDSKAEFVFTKLSDSGLVKVTDESGRLIRQFRAFPGSLPGGIVSTLGDLDADGRDEISVAPYAGSTQIRIFDARGRLRRQFFSFDRTRTGGVRLTTIDRDADGRQELAVIAADGQHDVRLFSPVGKRLRSFRLPVDSARVGLQIDSIL